MAKQKAKLPLKRAASVPAAPGKAAVAAGPAGKLKVKNAGKLKAENPADEVAPREASLPRKRFVKVKRKPQRGKRQPSAAAVAADALVTSLGASPAVIPTLGRPRKMRPPPALGRLDRLEIAIAEVRLGGRMSPRTRKLLASGVPKMAQKVIEEAAEVAIEAIRGEHAAFVNEAVDLFFNLVALSSELGIPLAAIWAEMDRREQALGMAEKLPKSGDS